MGHARHYYLGRNPGRRFKGRPGMVVVHNHILHTRWMGVGANGFRAWQQMPHEDLQVCRCGWAGIEHYRIRGTRRNLIEEIPAARWRKILKEDPFMSWLRE